MKNSKIKIAICLVWLIGIVGIVLIQKSNSVSAKGNMTIPKPEIKEVEKFNALILDRFLTEPQLGGRRLIPPNIHLESFAPKNQAETSSVNYFEQKEWKVGIYLYGRIPTQGSVTKHLSFYYKTIEPVPVTKNIKPNDLPLADDILSNVAKAFYEFQADEKAEEKIFEFTLNNWWYFARPVRAMNESCLKCHQSSVPVKSDGKYPFKFRERKIGDVNGVLVYAFQKAKK
jgi:Protein of unknown function (DUF3365)